MRRKEKIREREGERGEYIGRRVVMKRGKEVKGMSRRKE